MAGVRLAAVLIVAGFMAGWSLAPAPPVVMAAVGVEDRLIELAPARERIGLAFAHAGIAYPPRRLLLVGLKSERRLELYVSDQSRNWQRVTSYPLLGLGRGLGPKLLEGDRRTPEGFYRITYLNPNSRFHLSLQLDYPNRLDRARGARDGRKALGGDIVIHGGSASIGCLAVGDPAIEELFVAAAAVGLGNASVIISPIDFRAASLPEDFGETLPDWVLGLYTQIANRLASLPEPTGPAGT